MAEPQKQSQEIPSASTSLSGPPARRRPLRLAAAMLDRRRLVGAVLAGCGGSSSSSSGSDHQRRAPAAVAATARRPPPTPPKGRRPPERHARLVDRRPDRLGPGRLRRRQRRLRPQPRLRLAHPAQPRRRSRTGAGVEKWDFSKDGLTFNIYLKKGPEIHRRHAGRRGSGEDQPRTRRARVRLADHPLPRSDQVDQGRQPRPSSRSR